MCALQDRNIYDVLKDFLLENESCFRMIWCLSIVMNTRAFYVEAALML